MAYAHGQILVAGDAGAAVDARRDAGDRQVPAIGAAQGECAQDQVDVVDLEPAVPPAGAGAMHGRWRHSELARMHELAAAGDEAPGVAFQLQGVFDLCGHGQAPMGDGAHRNDGASHPLRHRLQMRIDRI